MKQHFDEATAGERIGGIVDPGSFREILGPELRLTSPHLGKLDMPVSFNDGILIGEARLNGQPILIAAQEGAFMGGSVGEVHGAKLTGLLERATTEKPAAILLLLDTGGVRLHEANAGLIAISEIMTALLRARQSGLPVHALIGGKFGCFGGMGIVAGLCDSIIMTEQGRLGLSGPDVIEASCGVEEFDASDRPLVWRTTGGKHRFLLGDANMIVENDLLAFRTAAISCLTHRQPLDGAELDQEQTWLSARLDRFSACRDSRETWSRLGIENPERIPSLDIADFLDTAKRRLP